MNFYNSLLLNRKLVSSSLLILEFIKSFAPEIVKPLFLSKILSFL